MSCYRLELRNSSLEPHPYEGGGQTHVAFVIGEWAMMQVDWTPDATPAQLLLRQPYDRVLLYEPLLLEHQSPGGTVAGARKAVAQLQDNVEAHTAAVLARAPMNDDSCDEAEDDAQFSSDSECETQAVVSERSKEPYGVVPPITADDDPF